MLDLFVIIYRNAAIKNIKMTLKKIYNEEKERERRDKSGRIEKRKDITSCGPKDKT